MSEAPTARIAPPAFLAGGAPSRVLAALPGARAVGGCVRDAIAGLAVQDVDIAAPFPPEAIAERLRAAGLKVFETGLAHGTLTAVLDREPVEVTALRRDVATDGRHAEVAWTTDWREDAERRDFRINAMSCDAVGHLWDYFGGREDLAAGRVRFVGDPATRLAEDYLRALRFFRFWARYGRGAPDAAALAAIRAAIPGLIARIAPERIWMELKRLLEAPDPVPALDAMAGIGLLQAVLPEGAEPSVLGRAIIAGVPADPVLRLAILIPRTSDPAELPCRLRWSKEESGRLVAARHLDEAPLRRDLDEADLRRLLARHKPAALLARGWVLEAWGLLPGAAALRRRIAAAPVPVFPLRGQDLLDLGLAPGFRLGQRLGELREWWIGGGCIATRAECLAEARKGLGAADGPAAPSRGE